MPAVAAAGVALLGLAATGKEGKNLRSAWTFDAASGAWRASKAPASGRHLDLGASPSGVRESSSTQAAVATAWFGAGPDQSGLAEAGQPQAVAATAAPVASRTRIDWTARRNGS